jgi:hypothetical protein
VIVFWAFAFIEGKRIQMKNYRLAIAGTLFVGLSLGLPLFLYAPETTVNKNTAF